jgi:excisionase family DNA binding protein
MVAVPRTIDPILVNSRQAARALAICERTLAKMTQSGDLPCIRNGRRRLYDPDDLKVWVQQQKTDTCV